MAHHLSRMAPHIVSPTPIRPHSPASPPSRGERGNTPPQKTGYLDAEAPLADEQEAGEMCAELMEIFSTGSPRCAPPGPGGSGGQACLDSLKPPSRNQNPLPKDQHFSKGTSARQGDDFAVKLSAALCGEILRNTSCLSPPLPSPTADSFKA